MKAKRYFFVTSSLIILLVLLYIVYGFWKESKCYICSGVFQSLISDDAVFGIINLNSRNPSTIPKGDWEDNYRVTINSSGDGSTIILSPDISGCYRADIYLKGGSHPDKTIMSDYLCRKCVDKYSAMTYDVILMDAASGSIYPISDNLCLELPPYKISALAHKDSQLIKLCFQKTE